MCGIATAHDSESGHYTVELDDPGSTNIKARPANLTLIPDPWSDAAVRCGSSLLNGRRRQSCQFACCVKLPAAESDEEWEEMRETKRAKPVVITHDEDRVPGDYDAVERCLRMRFREHGPNAAVAKKLRQCEKYEIACQGDDHSDKEHLACNSEALLYARAAAVAAGLQWSIAEYAAAHGEGSTLRRLQAEPFIGPMRAKQMHDLAVTGTCQALAAFESGRPPVGSDGLLRSCSDGGRSMWHAPARLALSKVLGVSTMTANALFDGTYKEGAFGPITSVAALRQNHACVDTLSIPWLKKQDVDDDEENGGIVGERSGGSGGGGGGVGGGRRKVSIAIRHSLRYHDELQLPVSADDARAMLAAEKAAATAAHHQRVSLRAAAADDATATHTNSALCELGWHAEFVGGARTKGRAGHDVDILVWHPTEPSCVGGGSHGSDYLIYALVHALTERADSEGRLLTEREGYLRIERRSDFQRRKSAVDGVHKHQRAPWMTWKTHNGIENLALCDYHDKCFGIWRTPTGLHHRIDIVVVAYPHELPFARLAWTGTRTLNRLMRLRAIHLGLNLGPHGFTAREHVRLTIDANANPPVVLELPPLGVVPREHCCSERDVLRILARGTDEFDALADPLNRNA